MHRPPNNLVYKTVVVVWLTLSLASVILAAVTWADLARKLDAALQANAIQDELDQILRLALDTETGQRGFTISGDDKFLEPMIRGEQAIPRHFATLAELARNDTVMLGRVVDLRAQVELCLAHHREAVELRRNRGIAASAALVASGKGRRIMDGVRTAVTVLRGMRSDLASGNGEEARSQLRRAIVTSLVAGIVGFGAGVYALWLARVMLGHQARERRLVEERLQAERMSQEKTVFLANMSHEIRTPMNAILGFAELLGAEVYEPKHRQFLQAIRTSAHSLLQLINDILDMSKIEAGVMELKLEPTDPREICDFLQTVFSGPTAKKGVKFECEVADDLPRALLMDRIRLRQVLVNLVGNAVKFTDHGEVHVRVNWERQENSSRITLLIEVDDTGVGIPADRLESIFKPFVQAGAYRDKERSGTGLGLSIVQRLTESMGGTVTAASVLGQGSAFSLLFPDVAISARLAPREIPESAGAIDFNSLAPATILVVDDNETNCQLMAGLFAGSHHRLHFGADGRQAVEMAGQLHPDLILLDIRMPGMDGREALTRLRKLPGLEMTPVLAVTASSLLREELELKQQFNGYVRKPFSRRELYDEVAQFLPRRAADQEPASRIEPAEVPAAIAPELALQLARLREKEWPGIRDSVAIGESGEFAAKLERLAKRWNCGPLDTYALGLRRHAENYAVVELEQQLFEFGGLVDRLSGTSSQ